MSENHDSNSVDNQTEDQEPYPIEPRYHPINRIPRAVYDFFASAKLAMFLLVAILACCLVGTTIYRGVEAGDKIFSTLWFNFLLVLLIVNVACCFFGRIWGRRVTLVSLGMILFHLSFVSMFIGIIYNSLYCFRGSIRLTEGESLPIEDLQSYDFVDKGRFFKFSKLRGELSLVKLHTGYTVDGKDKRVAYEVSVGYGPQRQQEIIYATKHIWYRGFKFFPDKEGYSVLAILSDNEGRELYGAHLPLQSLKQSNEFYLYTTGSKDGPGTVLMPPEPEHPLVNFNVSYLPDAKKERSGEAVFQLFPMPTGDVNKIDKFFFEGKAPIGSSVNAGKYTLSVREVRYWAAMAVRYEPGQPIVLTSLWIGLFGMVLTTVARMYRKKKTVPLES